MQGQWLKNGVRIVALALMLLPGACGAGTSTTAATATAPATRAATRPADPPPMHFDSTKVVINGKEYTLEVAETAAQADRGLMYRDSMADDRGMLFVFAKPDVVKFWMKNTRIPLDIIFLDKDCRVVQVVAAKALDETSVGPDTQTQYVIELNLGGADKAGLRRGDKVEIPKKYLRN